MGFPIATAVSKVADAIVTQLAHVVDVVADVGVGALLADGGEGVAQARVQGAVAVGAAAVAGVVPVAIGSKI